MPTSSGKTLLAKFTIVQTKALNPNGRIVYVVPTRALVNQVTIDLRADFRELNLRVEQTVPAFELDPTEERLLQAAPDILVSTPEKLDLLIRRDHPVTRDIALVIADEAHNITDQGRGARLELLLGMIKRDRADARFLLLSPFLPNDLELVQWLGEDRALPPIRVDWKPGRRLVGAVQPVGRGQYRSLVFETLDAAGNADVRAGMQIPIGGAPTGRTISRLTRATIQAMQDHGSVLVLCRGPGTSMTRAGEIAEEMPHVGENRELDSICRYLEMELGPTSALSAYLRHGVAYHHAGMSQEARFLVECLIRRGLVKVVCGTTTLAQGVNFPITTVVVETLQKGDVTLTYQDFWNIAGRAGRTLMDSLGVIAFPTRDAGDRARYEEFLRGEALEISSQLASLVDRADEIADRFNLRVLYSFPQLSSLLQFLAHAMRVSGDEHIADEVEDILRASLVYHQMQRHGDQAVQRLILLCRSYLEHIQGQRGMLVLADKTGFSTPSVLKILQDESHDPELATPGSWMPDRLFGDDIGPLRRRVEAVSELPEIQLGQSTRPRFAPERIAGILQGWVQGESLERLTELYWIADAAQPQDRKVAEFSRYLFSQLLGSASWGIGALESICLAGEDQNEWIEAGYVPSMIFFGVKRKEAVWLRMVGVPRVVADRLADLWQGAGRGEPESYDDVRNWVTGLSDADWVQAIPRDSQLTPQDMRMVWDRLAGL